MMKCVVEAEEISKRTHVTCKTKRGLWRVGEQKLRREMREERGWKTADNQQKQSLLEDPIIKPSTLYDNLKIKRHAERVWDG